MPLSKGAQQHIAAGLRDAPDETIRRPLWEWHPSVVPLVLHERRVRFGVPTDEDFDPEYS
jgi:hypothetical protein